MNHDAFEDLNRLITSSSPGANRALSARARPTDITVESQLALTLGYLARASYLDLVDVHGISRTSIYESINKIMEAIEQCDSIGQVCWSDTPEALEKASRAFSSRSTSGDVMTRFVGAIDGLFVAIKAPSKRETLRGGKFYYGNKSAHGLNCRLCAMQTAVSSQRAATQREAPTMP